jgi:hypothetical protein
LLTLRLLADSDADGEKKEFWEPIIQEELVLLKSGLKLARESKELRMAAGGDTVKAGMKIAEELKARVEKEHVDRQLKHSVDHLTDFQETLPWPIQYRKEQGATYDGNAKTLSWKKNSGLVTFAST